MTESLKDKILKEIVVDYKNALEKNFELTKEFIRLTKDGKVDLMNKSLVKGKDQILLYLIGKMYAKEAGLSETDAVSNKELLTELGMVEGSLFPWIKGLRDSNIIKTSKSGQHSIQLNQIERILLEIKQKQKLKEIEPVITENKIREDLPSLRSKSPTKAIQEALSTSWGDTPRTLNEIADLLKINGLHYSKTSISPLLLKLIRKGSLRRLKEGEIYAYVASRK